MKPILIAIISLLPLLSAALEKAKPNIILIFSDEHKHSCLTALIGRARRAVIHFLQSRHLSHHQP